MAVLFFISARKFNFELCNKTPQIRQTVFISFPCFRSARQQSATGRRQRLPSIPNTDESGALMDRPQIVVEEEGNITRVLRNIFFVLFYLILQWNFIQYLKRFHCSNVSSSSTHDLTRLVYWIIAREIQIIYFLKTNVKLMYEESIFEHVIGLIVNILFEAGESLT